MKLKRIWHLLMVGSIALGLISCGSVEQLKIPAKADYKSTGKLGKGEVVKIKTREDVTLKVKYLTLKNPKAQVLLLTGHYGRLKLSNTGKPLDKSGRGDFLARNIKGFLASGFSAALVDCPSDNCRENKGMLWGFRDTEEHAIDMTHVIAYLKEKNPNLPIWVIGSGRGTESAINVVLRMQDSIAGLVLASSTTENTEFGTSVEEYDLEKVKIPVLAISHEDDVCPYSDPDDQEDILDDMENAKVKKLVILEGGEEINIAFNHQRCKNKSQHMFWTVEDDAMTEITKFINSQL